MTCNTTICKWKGNKKAAYSVGGDDSLESQISFAIPEMTKRGISGTWWINCERDAFKTHEAGWRDAAKAGHDFANHTLRHQGAATIGEADREIGGAARRIWELNPGQKLQLFLCGGGTKWGISNRQREKILEKYHCVDDSVFPNPGRNGKSGGIEDRTWNLNHRAEDFRNFVDAAISEGSWHLLGLHGIGPDAEYGGQTDGEAFIALCDYLAERKNVLWTASHLAVHKYVRERNNSTVRVQKAGPSEVRVVLSTSLDTSPGMYDHPLTLRTVLPGGLAECRITQSGSSRVLPAAGGEILYEAIPNSPEILVSFISGPEQNRPPRI